MIHDPTHRPSAASSGGSAAIDGPAAAATAPKLAALVEYLDGLRSRADLDVLAELLAGLDVSRCDIACSCVFGARGYRRNTIRSSAWFELLALCWHSGDRTPIHDHQGVSCAFKVIEGTGTEIRFKPTPSGLICPVEAVEMEPGYVCAAADADIHQVANMQAAGQDLITLHIYSPPIKKMNTYAFVSPIPEECSERYAAPKSARGGDEFPC